MANWKHTFNIKDLHQDGERDCDDDDAMVELGRAVAARLRLQPWFTQYPELERIAGVFEMTDDQHGYNRALHLLYDWADEDHRCWVKTF